MNLSNAVEEIAKQIESGERPEKEVVIGYMEISGLEYKIKVTLTPKIQSNDQNGRTAQD